MCRILPVLSLLVMGCVPPAWAHAFLTGSSPPVGSDVPVAPAELTLRFTEPVEPLFCSVELTTPTGDAVKIPKPQVQSGNPQALIVSLPHLGPGIYTVVWHVTSVDTHKTEGKYQFTVGP